MQSKLHAQKSALYFLRFALLLLLFNIISDELNAQTSFIDSQTPSQAKPGATNLTASWQLKFSDEFNDNTIDVSKWTVQESLTTRDPRAGLGISSWFWKPDNAFEENGNLVLRVDKVSSGRMHCGAVNSNNKYETKYGYYECRVKIAQASKGTHTAFWFQGDGQGIIDGTGNDGAEIDIFESAWLEDYTKAVMHIDGYGSARQANTKQYTTPGIHEGYHTFGMLWTPDYINIYYDGVLKTSFTGDKWKVNANEYIFLSDGASFGFSGDNFKVEPIGELTRAYFDYVRVWQLDDYECFLASKEMESIPSTAVGATKQVLANTSASGGQILRLNADAAGDELILDNICHPEAGYYSYDLKAFKFTSFGKYKMSVELSPGQWQQFEQEMDLYGTSGSITTNFGSVFLTAGNHRLKLTCTGKNASSTSFLGSFDLLTLKPGVPDISCFISPTATELWSAEAESGQYTGAAALEACATASNGKYINLNPSTVTKRLTFTNVTAPTAGNYILKVFYVSNGPRNARVEVNGVSLGSILFPTSGAWCFDGGSPSSYNILVRLNAGTNTIAFLNNSSNLLPLFDRLVLQTTTPDTDGDGVPDTCDVDDDNDGVSDAVDVCPLTANADQLDTDGDGIGNVCDEDDDNDTVLDAIDNCPLVSNTNQLDTDGDGIGNVCDDDDDNDSVLDTVDNCPLVSNTNQLDTDGDGIGNICDEDDDNDGVLDVVDNCPLVSNTNQLDTDGDGMGNVCDEDDDNDGAVDVVDNCPLISNSDQLDTDGDGIGNICDEDDDNDGVLDVNDNCPLTVNSSQADTDNDGIGNICDNVFNMQSFIKKMNLIVDGLQINNGNKTALSASLNNALVKCQQGNLATCINNLNALINKLQALRGKSIPEGVADNLIESTTYAIQSINQGQSDCALEVGSTQQKESNQLVLEQENYPFTLYPNPLTSGAVLNLHIPGNPTDESQTLQIVEIASGRIVYSKLITSHAQRISISTSLTPGTYLVRLSGIKLYATQKLIVIN